MKTNKIKLLAKLACKKEIHREQIKVVKFSKGKAVATDSFALVELSGYEGEAVLSAHELKKVSVKGMLEITNTHITLLQNGIAGSINSVKDEFPKYEYLFMKEKDCYAPVRVNAQYLIDVLKILKGLDPFDTVQLLISKEEMKPLTLKVEGKARALLMPLAN